MPNIIIMLRLVIAKPTIDTKVLVQSDVRPLIQQDWSLERITREARPPTWGKVWDDAYHELKDVSEILDNQEKTYGHYYPLKKDIFNAFWLTKLSNVKLVILGQDPYHQTISVNNTAVPRSTGTSFSVRREDTVPSSLKNIYTELANTVRGFTRPDHGDLTEWTEQGVLLLNTCLTVRSSQPGSHKDIWLGFISKVFKAIAIVNPYCVFLLWGRDAQKVKPMLGERSIILEAAHPSGLSASRGFFGCNHFNEANKHLLRLAKPAINWKISTVTELTNPSTNVLPVISTNIERTFVPININDVLAYVPPTKISSGNINNDNSVDNAKNRVVSIMPTTRSTVVLSVPSACTNIAVPNIPIINYNININNAPNNFVRPIIPNYNVNI